jgi:hypothetical protein
MMELVNETSDEVPSDFFSSSIFKGTYWSGSVAFLSEEKGKHNQHRYKETGKSANARQIAFHIGVIGVEFRARGLGRHAH